MSDPTTDSPAMGGPAPGASAARQLFRYLSGDEWHEYRAILDVFAGTFFAEFSPDEVASAVAHTGIDVTVVPDRLESLRRWGNLTVSSSVGNPTSLDDYYRRRNRYLITRSGQEVVELVERVLAGIDEIGDVQAGRLRDLHRSLLALVDLHAAGLVHAGPERVADAVRNVFDLHERFTTELTAFFAELNLWQSRYDLDADEVQFFAGVLVDYVAEQLTEIERMARPIARTLDDLRPLLPDLVAALRTGLASRVDDAGLADRVAVRRLPGTRIEDWDHLGAWFVGPDGRPSRLDQLTRQAVAAVRTLTANVTRLSRIGLGAASRRGDFIRLATFFDHAADADAAHTIASAAFGLGSCRHLGVLADDADDPVATTTPWIDAPRAGVPISLRERGDTAKRGSASPVRDRSTERDLLRRRRDQERVDAARVAAELLSSVGDDGVLDGATLSTPAFATLRDLIARSGLRAGVASAERTAVAHGITATLIRSPYASTTVTCPEGRLTMADLVVRLEPADAEAGP